MESWLIILLLFVSGCASMDTKLKNYLGKPLTEIIASNGIPTRTLKIDDHTEIDEWVAGNVNNLMYARCVVDLTVINGIVDKYAFRGDKCEWWQK